MLTVLEQMTACTFEDFIKVANGGETDSESQKTGAFNETGRKFKIDFQYWPIR